MAYIICNLIFFLCVFPLWIQGQSGSFAPLTGRIDTLDYVSYYRMITERECISKCLQSASPACYGISYESFRQECRLITESVPSTYQPNKSFMNWLSFIRTENS